MKIPTTKPIQCSRRSFLSTCIFSAVSFAVTPTLLAGEATPPESIDIPSYSPEQAREQILHFIQNGWEAPLSVLLGVLIAKSWGLSSEDRPIEVMKRFFSVPAVRRILKYLARGNADERVIAKLQSELDKSGNYRSLTPFWIGLSAWLKVRIIDCFSHGLSDADRRRMIVAEHPRLEDLLRLPIKEAD